MKHLLLIAALALPGLAAAESFTIGDITIDRPYAFATVGNAPVGGGYMEITNGGATDDTLLSVSVDAETAAVTQLHQMAMEEGVMRMSEVEGGIPIPAGETVVLESGGLHVMFLRLADGLVEGEEIPATLTFAEAGTVEVVFDVVARGSEPKAHGDGHGH